MRSDAREPGQPTCTAENGMLILAEMHATRGATLSLALACSTQADVKPMNSLLVIAPYRHARMWVFDDDKAGLRQEPFVSGADDIIDVLVRDIPDAEKGFTLVFSASPFPGYQAKVVRSRSEHGGTWYKWPEKGMEGWLCPALFKYFPSAPPEIYVQAKMRRP